MATTDGDETAADHKYTIVTYTGGRMYSGTDANVFIKLCGSKGDSEEIQLHNKDNKNEFEAKSVNRFELQSKDLGIIYKVFIRHDNSGQYPGWYLNRVKVIDDASKREYDFAFYSWLAKSDKYKTEAVLESGVMPVVAIDQLNSKNRPEHHTDKFQSEAFIIRRGQSFFFDLLLARDYNPKADKFHITLSSGKRPRDFDKTLVHIPLVDEFDYMRQKWAFKIIGSENRKLSLEVNCPHDALVAEYDLLLESDVDTVFKHEQPFFILFNAWCPEDDVYMKDDEHRKEYVLRQHGRIWIGSSRWPRPLKWYFGSYESIALECAFELLKSTKPKGRDTAIEVARRISAMVNSNQDRGLLVGNWSGEYDDGTAPTAWTSSTAIMKEYMEEKKPVEYGQCWVFSALTTTVLRTLGIPTRSITNFNSAHDTDKNDSHDIYLDEEGEEIEGMSADSIWNFHCWNDSWMARPDLSPGYGGWQAVDATPQELSRGLFQMGPSALRAVKEGDVDLDYDTQFVLAEVNADVIFWKKNTDTGEWEATDINRKHVGKKISTKAVGTDGRHDITLEYKFPEGSILERGSVKKALLKSGNISVASMPKFLEMKVKPDKIVEVGNDIHMNINVKNTSSNDVEVNLVMAGSIVRYNGISKGSLEKIKKKVTVKGDSEENVSIAIKAKNYLPHLNEYSMVRFYVTCLAKETGQVLTATKVVDIQKPELKFEGLPETLTVGKEVEFFITFVNPLSVKLTNCEVHLDGTAFKETLRVKHSDIEANSSVKVPVKITPNVKAGTRSIFSTFESKQLAGIRGDIKVKVEELIVDNFVVLSS